MSQQTSSSHSPFQKLGFPLVSLTGSPPMRGPFFFP
jgi:hypothetical protein